MMADIVRISKTFRFEASHSLTTVPEHHPCFKLHGHSYQVTVSITGPVHPNGMVYDYHNLDAFKYHVDEHCDHVHLNDIVDVTTAEMLAIHFYGVMCDLYPFLAQSYEHAIQVEVNETENTSAVYPVDPATSRWKP